MMFKLGRTGFLCLTAIALSGCSMISKPSFLQYRDKNYLSARSIPPLRIPPGTSSSRFEDKYPIPYRNYSNDQKDVSLVPPGLKL